MIVSVVRFYNRWNALTLNLAIYYWIAERKQIIPLYLYLHSPYLCRRIDRIVPKSHLTREQLGKSFIFHTKKMCGKLSVNEAEFYMEDKGFRRKANAVQLSKDTQENSTEKIYNYGMDTKTKGCFGMETCARLSKGECDMKGLLLI